MFIFLLLVYEKVIYGYLSEVNLLLLIILNVIDDNNNSKRLCIKCLVLYLVYGVIR